MADLKPSGASLSTDDGRLQVDFQWHRDRFVHKVFVDQREVGFGVEGESIDPWHASPPVQQISREEIDGASVILVVGAAGQVHWSISVHFER